MAFMISENEQTPYGTEVLDRIRPARTVGQIAAAVGRLNRSAGGKAFTWIMGPERPVGFMSVTACADGLVLNAMPDSAMPPPVPATQFIAGITAEAKGEGSLPMFVKFDDGPTKKIESARLECIDGANRLYVITLEPGEELEIKASKDADVEAPRNSDDVQLQLRRLAQASGRPGLPDEVLLCRIPSVPSKYVEDEEVAGRAGTTCVVDAVTKKNQHLELELMSVSPDEMMHMQLNPGEQSAEAVAAKCARFGAGLPLFFMYVGKPYAASGFSTEIGSPPTLTLEPWADVDEDADEIRMMAAKHVADGLI